MLSPSAEQAEEGSVIVTTRDAPEDPQSTTQTSRINLLHYLEIS